MVWGSFPIAAAALKTPTRNGDTAQGVSLHAWFFVLLSISLCSLSFISLCTALFRHGQPLPRLPPDARAIRLEGLLGQQARAHARKHKVRV